MKVAAVILFLFINSPNIFTQTGTTLMGKVVDKETGESLIGGNILVLGTELGSASDTLGNYQIKNLPVGNYSIKVAFMGYRPIQIENVLIINTDCLVLDFELEWDSNSPVLVISERYKVGNKLRYCRPPEDPKDFLKPRGLFIESIIEKIKSNPPVMDSIIVK